MRNIGERIKFTRKKQKLTQNDLALKIKVDRSLISKIEKNGSNSLGTIEKIAIALGVSISDLLDDIEPGLCKTG